MERKEIIVKDKVSNQFAEAPILNRMEETKSNGYYRDSAKYKEVVWGGINHKMYKNPMSIDDAIFQKGFFLFSQVKSNVVKYLKEHNDVVPDVEVYPVNYTNWKFFIKNGKIQDDIPIVGVDLTAAYWYIARNMGFINENTFQKGLEHITVEFKGEVKQGDLLKPVRLSALSVLGKKKTYYKIIDGVKTKEVEYIGGNELQEKVYRIIRLTCYYHMHMVQELLGMNEFMCWKTDCIFFHDLPENRKKVYDYFDSVNLNYKTLEKPTDSEGDGNDKELQKAVKEMSM